MLTIPQDGDIAQAAPFLARAANRLARHIPTAPARLAIDTPLVSFTFDDAPDSACTTGADLLDAYDAKGTFYISGALIGTEMPFWRLGDDATIARLHGDGHEIGCHTHAHVFLPKASAADVALDVRRNQERLGRTIPDLVLENFAYPYGFASLSAKRVLGRAYRTCRGIVPGLNSGQVDPHYLRAHPLVEGRIDADDVARLMDEALARNGWLIFYGHDVVEQPSRYGCSPRLLEAALRAAEQRGIPGVSIAEGLRRVGA